MPKAKAKPRPRIMPYPKPLERGTYADPEVSDMFVVG
jgi:hypothetical protein